MDLLQGIDLQQGREVDLTVPVVPNRILHIDADIVAYEIANKEGGFIKRKDIKSECHCYVQALKEAAGAEIVVCHTTPKGSTKGDRYNMARLKIYQGNRKGKVKPPQLEWTREYLVKPDGNTWFGIAHFDQEADDGLAQALYDAHQEGKPELAVCASYDKDLRMLQGLHMDWLTHDVTKVTKLGLLEERGSKVWGCGMRWFFLQMLTGDGADNISGLPKLTIEMNEEYFGKTPKNHKNCGAKTAMRLLEGCESIPELFNVVARCYASYGKEVGFKSYSDKPVTARTAFLSEAYLLWMRQTKDNKDFNRWMKAEGLIEAFKEIL